jgi:polysaccharide biosynthesis protein PslH
MAIKTDINLIKGHCPAMAEFGQDASVESGSISPRQTLPSVQPAATSPEVRKPDRAKTRFLFVGLCPPVPTTNGQRIRNRNLLLALKKEGVDVVLLAFAEPSELEAPPEELFLFCESVQLIPTPKRNGRLKELVGRFANLFMSDPYGPRRFRSESMTSTIRKALSEGRFQAIVCDEIYLAANLPKDLSVPILLNKHDLTYEIVARYLETERNFAKRLYGSLEHRKIRRMEIGECKRVQAVLACSARDKELIERECPDAKVFVLPNVVNTDDYSPVPSEETDLILFFGSLDWLPNRDAVEHFVTRIFPRLRNMHHQVRFAVAGRLPPPWFSERLRAIPGVQLYADIPDVRALIARAAVCVVPLRIGSGTRLKILEAAAMGKPTVSTRLGAEGLDFVENQEIVLEDKPERFAAEVCKLLNDESRRRSIGQAARKRVEKQYSVPALCDALRQVIAVWERE